MFAYEPGQTSCQLALYASFISHSGGLGANAVTEDARLRPIVRADGLAWCAACIAVSV
jgi:hypothetical protein